MTLRAARGLACTLAAAALWAPAAAADPLAGTGLNIQPIARVPLDHPTEVELAGDWAFVADGGRGLVIVNVADPQRPYVQGRWHCPAGWGDVDLSPAADIAVLTNSHRGECFGSRTAAVLLDTSDKSAPRLLGRIRYDDDIEYVHTSTLDGDLLYLNPQAAAFYPQMPAQINVFDVSDPSRPRRAGLIRGRGPGLAHDTYIDHRPDGRDLMYAASVHQTDVFDVTDPFAPRLLQQMVSPEITMSHDAQPNHDRTMIVVDDEGLAGGQLEEEASVCGRAGGRGPAAVDSGSVHFYAAAPDGTFAGAGAVELGSWNAPPSAGGRECVAHVFWQAPDENRMTQAYYRLGAFVLDFEDPADARMLGSFVADGGVNYWSVKPHRGYLFATSKDQGLDVLRYTGEDGRRWPATAGPAEVQRSSRQGMPYEPIPVAGEDPSDAAPPLPVQPVDERAVGRVRFTARLRRIPGRPGTRVPVRLSFRDRAGERVGRLVVRRPARRRARVRIAGAAVAGRYSWTATARGRRVARGRIVVRPRAGMGISPSSTLVVRER